MWSPTCALLALLGFANRTIHANIFGEVSITVSFATSACEYLQKNPENLVPRKVMDIEVDTIIDPLL